MNEKRRQSPTSRKSKSSFENSELRDTNRNYQKTNRNLHKQLTDYRLLRKVLGSKNVDRLLDEAKGKNKNEKEKSV